MWKFCILFLLVQNLAHINGEVTLEVNPGCDEKLVGKDDCESKPWVLAVHNTPNQNGSEYFHVWGGVGSPSLVVLETPCNATLEVNWKSLLANKPNSITTRPAPINTFAVAITELILFDDQSDTGSITSANEEQQLHLPAELFSWSYRLLNTTGVAASVSFYTTHFNGTELHNDTSVEILLENTVGDSRGEVRPRLITSASSTSVTLSLNNLTLDVYNPHPSQGPDRTFNHHRVVPLSHFTAPRWAIHLTIASSESGTDERMELTSHKSLDDEYAPGVFKLDQITTPNARESDAEGGFVQWRPICYLNDNLDVNQATLPNLSAPNDTTNATANNEDTGAWIDGYFFGRISSDESSELKPLEDVSDELKQSLLYSVLGDAIESHKSLAVETIVSFGLTDDGFYTSANYTSWTLVVGSGSPPKEGLSQSVLIVIVIGLGLPVVVMVLAGIIMAIWRIKKRRGPQHDALLEHEN